MEHISTIELNNFLVQVYKLKSNKELSKHSFDNIISNLNSKLYPRNILEVLEAIEGIGKIEIFDKNNNLLLSSSVV
jgi:hypothetical protein